MEEVGVHTDALPESLWQVTDVLRERGLLPEAAVCVYASGSLVRGWEHANSDVDLYVVTDEQWSSETATHMPVALSPNSVLVESIRFAEFDWDIEYWSVGQVTQMLAKLDSAKLAAGGMITVFERDFLERLLHSAVLDGADWWRQRRADIDGSAFRPWVARHAIRNCDTFVDDALGMVASGDHDSAVLAARLAFTHAVDALLTSVGVLARSPKWHSRRFRQVTVSVLTYDDYWAVETMRDYDVEDPETWIRHVLQRCRAITAAIGTQTFGTDGE